MKKLKIETFLNSGWILTTVVLAIFPTSVSAAAMHRPAHHVASAPTGPKIKVLLEKDVSSAFLEAKGSYRVIRKDNGTSLSSGKVGKRFVVHALQDGLRWGEEYPDVFQIALVPLSPETCFLVNGIQYRGTLSIYHIRDNHIAIINEISIEEFVKSTLAIKYEEVLSREAMAALTIAARTEAYHKVLQGQNSPRPWDISAVEAGYYGIGVAQQKNGVDQAVDWTRYMVLESVKKEGPLERVHLMPEKAEELAVKGFNAQKILKATFPQAKIGATIDPDELAIR